jgi:hypothetical protein
LPTGNGNSDAVRGALGKVGVPFATAAAGVVGGIVLGRTALQRNRKALGVPVPNKRIDFRGVSEQIGQAGRQFGQLASEVRAVREKAEQIGRVIS